MARAGGYGYRRGRPSITFGRLPAPLIGVRLAPHNIQGKTVRNTVTAATLAFATIIAGCAAGNNFKPTTAEGANCKTQCARDMTNCRGSSYSCDRAAATCMASCEDLDRVISSGASASGQPQWVKLISNSSQAAYADPATIRRNGSLVRMSDLGDFKAAEEFNGKRYMSSKGLNEYDCDKRRARILSYTFYSGNMARGEVVFADPEGSDWIKASPGSFLDALLAYACR